MAFRSRKIGLTIAAGKVQDLNADEYLFLFSASADLEIAGEDGVFGIFPARRGYRVRPGEKIGRVTIRNPTGGTVTGVAVTGTGEFLDGALGGSAPLEMSISAPSPVPVAGPEATGAAPVGNPVAVAGLDTGAKVRPFLVDTDGRQVVEFAATTELESATHLFAVAGPITLLAAVAAKKHKVATVIVSNAGIVDDTVILFDNATEIARFFMKAGESRAFPFALVPLAGSVNTDLKADVIAGGGSISVTVSGWKAA